MNAYKISLLYSAWTPLPLSDSIPYFISGKNFMQIAPLAKVNDSTKPIDCVRISVGKISLITEYITGSMQVALNMTKTMIDTTGVQENVSRLGKYGKYS